VQQMRDSMSEISKQLAKLKKEIIARKATIRKLVRRDANTRHTPNCHSALRAAWEVIDYYVIDNDVTLRQACATYNMTIENYHESRTRNPPQDEKMSCRTHCKRETVLAERIRTLQEPAQCHKWRPSSDVMSLVCTCGRDIIITNQNEGKENETN